MESTLPANQVDWNLVRERYLEGTPADQIATECGITVTALRNKAFRAGWTAIRSAASALARNEKSEEARQCLVENLLRDVRGWRNDPIPDKETEQYERYSRSRERLVATAARVFGWETGPDTKSTADDWRANAVDVETVTVQTQRQVADTQ